MRKIIILFILIFATIFSCGCNEKTDNYEPISLYVVDIDCLNNEKILDVVNNKYLDEGAYLIITDSNKYVFFKGCKKQYTNINLQLENKTLFINCHIKYSSKNTSSLYLIKEKNTTSSNNKYHFFDTILLKINNKEVPFNSIIKL